MASHNVVEFCPQPMFFSAQACARVQLARYCSPGDLRNLDCIHVYAILEPTLFFCYFDVVAGHLADAWMVVRGSEFRLNTARKGDG